VGRHEHQAQHVSDTAANRPDDAPENGSAAERAAQAALRARNLRTLAVLAGLFLLPLAGSFLAYYGTSWRPAGHVNHGTLITPVRTLPAVAADSRHGALFRGQWSLVYVGDGACDEDCRAALYFMRQTRLGLGTDMTRVARVFVATGHCCDRAFLEREHPGLTVIDSGPDGGAGGSALAGQFPAADRADTLFVVDPLGNLMMSYDARRNPHGLLEDLKKLLRLSQIG
jgi:hypothetical protein